jgi:hypothetical protein
MPLSATFWSAFLAGLAAPIGVYAAPAPYMAYVGGYTASQSFTMVANYLARGYGAMATDAESSGIGAELAPSDVGPGPTAT